MIKRLVLSFGFALLLVVLIAGIIIGGVYLVYLLKLWAFPIFAILFLWYVIYKEMFGKEDGKEDETEGGSKQ